MMQTRSAEVVIVGAGIVCERSEAIHGPNCMDRHGLRPRDDEGMLLPRDDDTGSRSVCGAGLNQDGSQ